MGAAANHDLLDKTIDKTIPDTHDYLWMNVWGCNGVELFLNAPHKSSSWPSGTHPDCWLWRCPLLSSGLILPRLVDVVADAVVGYR